MTALPSTWLTKRAPLFPAVFEHHAAGGSAIVTESEVRHRFPSVCIVSRHCPFAENRDCPPVKVSPGQSWPPFQLLLVFVYQITELPELNTLKLPSLKCHPDGLRRFGPGGPHQPAIRVPRVDQVSVSLHPQSSRLPPSNTCIYSKARKAVCRKS